MSKNQQFQKFITYKSNAAKKEEFKQEKRTAKKERAAAIEKRFEEKRQAKSGTISRQQQEPLPPKKHAQKKDQPLADRSTTHQPVHQADNTKTGKKVRTPKPGSLEEKKLLAGMKPDIGSQKSEVGSQKSEVRHPTSDIKHQTSQIRHQTSDIRHPTSNIRPPKSGLMPLNKYVAHSGICSRRDAADMIRQGEVQVNGAVVTEPGTKVSQTDSITIKGKKITPSKNLVYILLNKPKDYITTLDDPEGRKTVLDLIKRATDERVYPVGRLDRNTSGVLLITNDGELAQTLSHPSNSIKKIYEVRLDKPLTKADFEKLQAGITLEDGFIVPDGLGYTDPKDKTIIGIEIHSGRNRIVRRIFEYLGYDVRGLDRVTYAGLTKKNVQRGKWRFLTEKEVRILRHFNPQTKKDKVKKAQASPMAKPEKK